MKTTIPTPTLRTSENIDPKEKKSPKGFLSNKSTKDVIKIKRKMVIRSIVNIRVFFIHGARQEEYRVKSRNSFWDMAYLKEYSIFYITLSFSSVQISSQLFSLERLC